MGEQVNKLGFSNVMKILARIESKVNTIMRTIAWDMKSLEDISPDLIDNRNNSKPARPARKTSFPNPIVEAVDTTNAVVESVTNIVENIADTVENVASKFRKQTGKEGAFKRRQQLPVTKT